MRRETNGFRFVIKSIELYLFLFLILFSGYRYMLARTWLAGSMFLIVSVLAAGWAGYLIVTRKKFYWPERFEIYLLLGLSFMVSAAHSVDPATSWDEIKILSIAAFLFFGVYNLVENGYNKNSLINALLWTGAVFLGLKIIQLVGMIMVRDNTCDKLFLLPNKTAAMAAMIAILGLGVALNSLARKRVFPGVLSAVGFIVLLLTGSRAGIVGGVFGLVLVVLLSGKLKQNWHYTALTAVAIISAFLSIIILRPVECKTLVPIINSETGEVGIYTNPNNAWGSNITTRFELWETATEIVNDYPLLGSGPGTFQIIAGPKHDYTRPTIHAHNIFYHAAAERGLIGLMTMILIFQVVIVTIARGQGDPNLLGVGLGVVVAVMVQGLLDVVYYEPFIMRFLFVLLALVLSSGENKNEKFLESCNT